MTAGDSPWRVRKVIDTQWLDEPLDAPDVLVLANVGHLSSGRAEGLRSLVEAGMGLMIFFGDSVEPDLFNDTLAGLSPVRYECVISLDAAGLNIEPDVDSPLSVLLRLSAEALSAIAPKRIGETVLYPSSEQTSRVLARWADAGRTPAVIERRIGRGRVLVWTVTADRGWSDCPTQPSYVLAMRRAALAIAGGLRQVPSLVAGEPIYLDFDTPAPAQVTLRLPHDEQPRNLTGEHHDEQTWFVFDRTLGAAVYTASWQTAMKEQNRLFSVNPDSRESELQRISAAELTQQLAPLDVEVIHYGTKQVAGNGQQHEMWRTLCLALLSLLPLKLS